MSRIVLRPSFAKDLDALRSSSRRHFQRASEILIEIQLGIEPSVQHRKETRIPKCERFDLTDGYRLVLQRSESANVLVALVVGNHVHVDSFLDAHKGCIFDAKNGRVCDMQVPTGTEAKVQRLAGPSGLTLDDLILRLNQQRQRATYGAIAGLLGGVTATELMSGRPRNRSNSWVVAATGSGYGKPSHYKEDDIHSECRRQIAERQNDFISDSKILGAWLSAWRR